MSFGYSSARSGGFSSPHIASTLSSRLRPVENHEEHESAYSTEGGSNYLCSLRYEESQRPRLHLALKPAWAARSRTSSVESVASSGEATGGKAAAAAAAAPTAPFAGFALTGRGVVMASVAAVTTTTHTMAA